MENEIFGKEEKIDFFTRVYKIKIVAESYNNEITDEQRKAYSEFKNNYEELLRKVPSVLLEYYIKIYDSYIDGIIEVPERLDKEHINEEKIVKLIKPRTLYIDKKGRYGLLCDCAWDEEHGIALLFENTSVSVIDQDELI